MPTSRFLQQDEDSARLPEGFTRIAYDADTRVYTYQDRHGRLYQGDPGNQYGMLNPVPKESSLEKTRPGAFASNKERSKSLDCAPGSTPSTFQDFLPPTLLTSSTLSEKSPTGLSSLRSPSGPGSTTPPSSASGAKSQFRGAVKKASVMQGVVHGLRRSMTTFRKSAVGAGSASGGGGVSRRRREDGADDLEDTRPLVHASGPSSSSLYRTATTSTTSTVMSDRTMVAVRQKTY